MQDRALSDMACVCSGLKRRLGENEHMSGGYMCVSSSLVCSMCTHTDSSQANSQVVDNLLKAPAPFP